MVTCKLGIIFTLLTHVYLLQQAKDAVFKTLYQKHILHRLFATKSAMDFATDQENSLWLPQALKNKILPGLDVGTEDEDPAQGVGLLCTDRLAYCQCCSLVTLLMLQFILTKSPFQQAAVSQTSGLHCPHHCHVEHGCGGHCAQIQGRPVSVSRRMQGGV